MNDLKFALRQLAKSPGFTAVAVLTLALGIGANTAIFSFVYTILLKPLPYPNPDRLVQVFENNVVNGWHKNAIGAPLIAEWRKQATLFEGIAARGDGPYALTGRGTPAVLSGAPVSANTFSLLRVKPLLGRDFVAEEETYGRHHVVLLSYECWRKRFGGDTNILGQSLTLNGELYQVIGVMPPRMQYPEPNLEVWTPLAFSPDQLNQRHRHVYSAFGRLKPGVTLASARAQMDLIAHHLQAADEQNKGWGVDVYPMLEIQVEDSRRLLLVLLGSVGLVLLICCANIANLLLARAAARGREFAVRAALGATRGHVVRQLLVESLLLATFGGIAGILVARFGLAVLLAVSAPDLPRIAEGVQVDGWALIFTAAITLLAGVLFGLAPAWQMSRQTVMGDMNDDAARGSSGGPTRRRLGSLFVVSQVAVSLMLLISAGLMIRSFGRLLSQDLGYQTQNLINIPFNLPSKTYPSLAVKIAFFEQLRERVATIPGVTSTALIYGLPLGLEDSQLGVEIVGAPPPRPGEAVSAGYSQISPGYFGTLGIPLLQGRDFVSQDRTNSSPVLIVDQTFVRNFKLGANPIGRLVNVGDGSQKAEIVGLVKDVKRRDLTGTPRGEMYRPYLQNCWGYMNLIVRTQRSPEGITRAIRSELDHLDKDLPLENIRTLKYLEDSALQQRRLSVELVSGFAGMALLLTALGLYGLLAYTVGQRSRELGIRMALGAKRSDVLSLVMGQGIRLTFAGLGLGLMAALAFARLLGSLLYEVKPSDPLTYVAVSGLILAVGCLACWLPALRATRVDPIQCLRHE